MEKNLKIFLSAGERSGDMHGANLIEAVRRREPSAAFVGLGLDRMRAAGQQPFSDMKAHSVLWLDALSRIPALFAVLKDCREYFRTQKPDCVVLIDYVGLNMYLAREAHKLGIPVFYYVAPQLWAHGPYRARKLRRWVRRMLVIYPFEEDFYRRWEVPVSYVGHPLFDELAKVRVRPEATAELRERFGDYIVALMPGSRTTETRRHGGMLAAAAEKIRRRLPQVRFLVAAGAEGEGTGLAQMAEVEGIERVNMNVFGLAHAARVCVVKSGTTTLEVAAAGCPMVVFYRASRFSRFIYESLRTCKYMCLVNELAGKELIPEKVITGTDSDWIAERTVELMAEDKAQTMRKGMAQVMDSLAIPGASERSARIILEHL